MNSNDRYLSKRLKKFIRVNAKSSKSKGWLSDWLSYQSQIAKLLVNGLKGVSIYRENRLVIENSVDVLFIHEVELMKKLHRKRGMFSRLDRLQITHAEIDPKTSKQIAKSRELFGCSNESLLFRNYDLYAQYLLETYSPKVIVTDRNGDLFSPFLKKRAAETGCKVVHLPHSVLTKESSKYRMIDYDYYLLYGASSLEHLNALTTKFGECDVILSGSYLFDSDFTLPPATEKGYVLLLGMGPAMEERPRYAQYYHSVLEWAERNPSIQLHVRLHPRSSGAFWIQAAESIDNVVVRPQGESFIDSCRGAFMCLTSYTNAVVDAALLGRPSLLVCGNDVVDYLQVERFFSSRVVDSEAISSSINLYKTQLSTFQKKAEHFAEYHVYSKNRSVEDITKVIVELVEGKQPTIECHLKGDC
ncbi:hypothetical protein KOI40_04110 [Aestuariicella sp. G3-2]|uniref:hypothetical protein n=1 Tax=Pseudomaricurvus albidus TaxID=2842452 RepID=UPI001C0CB575|nr:hypothetical protein [Aestuariicella albida]MBU3068990.1 hypothetical protein [Aestuariicella albida]